MKQIMNIVIKSMSRLEKDKARTYVMGDKNLTPFQKNLLITYIYCKPEKYKPTKSTLSSQFSVTPLWITKTHNKLKELGYIEIIHKSSATNNNNCDLILHLKFKKNKEVKTKND